MTDVFIVIATKGRSRELAVLLERLKNQTRLPNTIAVVGTSKDDLKDIGIDLRSNSSVTLMVSSTAGITVQRNVGLRWLKSQGLIEPQSIIIFFDDDFRPADDWIERCIDFFDRNLDAVGLTGLILADGAQITPLDDAEADAYLRGELAAHPHWASGSLRETASVYGCNMAFTEKVMSTCSFDEKLPLYSWQEDRDMTGQANKFGRVVFYPDCRGVHLGSQGGRTSGLRFGYSQIANMLYLHKKGTVNSYQTARFVTKSLLSNSARSVYTKRHVDYVGRLRGNLTAMGDLLRGRCDPRRILDL